jgi:myo-inositol 2-dehydrogenase / D-chiro-inositol 1-dehydrogenase
MGDPVIVKIALIGCGKQATKHIAGLKKCPGVEIVLADKVPELARVLAESDGLNWVATPEDVFANPEIVAVGLCVPTPFHLPLIRRSLSAKKHFFCEKPLCETAAEAREINDLAGKTGRIGMVGYVYRYAPVFKAVGAILSTARETGRSLVIGKLSVALMRIGGRGSAALWKHRRRNGGGAVNEMLVHMLDLAVWYFGPLERSELLMEDVLRPQRAIGGTIESVDAEDFVVARFWSRTGMPVVIQADLLTPSFTQMIEVQGDNGTLMASIQPEMPQFVFTLKAAAGYEAGRTELKFANVNFFDAQMAAFVAAIEGRPPSERSTLADSVHVMAALESLKA